MTLRIGTRGSDLALAQSRWVAGELARITGDEPEILIVQTSGDLDQQSELRSFGGTGAFTTAIDTRQRAGDFEVSVHSLKDLPTTGREGLLLTAVPARAPVEDCLITRSGSGLDGLREGAVVGTGSPRRQAQLKRLRPDLQVVPFRGNVDTRLRKVREGEVEATLLAHAGLFRLGLTDAISQVLDPDQMVPAAGQGALAIVVREGAAEALEAVRKLDEPDTHAAVDAERGVLGSLGGGCHLPMGVLATVADGRLSVQARVVSADGGTTIEEREDGAVGEASRVGTRLGDRLADAGARELLG